MPQGAPGLWRAVADCTQPQGPPAAGGASARALQKYLSDDKCVDAVYRTLITRACIEPQSEAVISKCIALLKQYLHRFTPSTDVLLELEACCQRLAASLKAQNPALHKSLVFMQTNVARLAGEDASVRMRIDVSRPSSAQASPHGSFSSAQGHASNGEAAVSPLGSRPAVGSISEEPGGSRALNRYSSSHVLHESADFSHSSSDALPLGAEHSGVQALGHALLVLAEGSPDWALDPAMLLHGVLGGTRQPEDDERDWAALLPAYQPSLVPLLAETFAGLGAEEVLGSQDVVEELTDAAPESIVQQIRDIAAMRRMQAPEALRKARGANTRLLFHHQPYTLQEPLAMSEPDIAAAVEIVCGSCAAAAASAVTGQLGDDETAAQQRYWQAPAAGGREGRESLGQVAASILMKLLLDMWLGLGPELALPLALRLLQQALHQPLPQLRARAFDIIYNLSLHGCLLSEMAGGWDGSAAAAAHHDAALHVHSSGEGTRPEAAHIPSLRMHSGGLSQLQPPHIHLPQQILQSPSSPRGSFAAAAAAATAAGSSSPLASPRSRLSRADRVSGLGSGFNPELSPTRRNAAAASGMATQGSGEEPQQEQQERQQEEEQEEEVPKEQQLGSWLRRLLFELLHMLAKLNEHSEEVWQAALGCLLHLTTHAGHWVRQHIQDLPLAAASALLRVCQTFHWSPELHSHLILLACSLLAPTEPSQQQQQEGESSSGGREQAALMQRLEAFGGLQEVLHHLCHAPSPAAERCLLAVLIQGVLLPGTPANSQAALLSTLCSSDARVAALRTGLHIGQPGLAAAVLEAATQACTKADSALLSSTLQSLEQVAVAARAAADAPGCSKDLVPAMAATIRHLRGEQLQTGAVAESAWAALRELCGCREGVAKEWATRWLQQLLQAALEEAAKGAIALPVPSAVQRADSPTQAATSALSETLNHVVSSCPEGRQLLVAALELLIAATKQHAQQQAESGDAARATAAAAKSALQAWAFVVQWVLHGAHNDINYGAKPALTRLANLALEMTGAATALPTEGPAPGADADAADDHADGDDADDDVLAPLASSARSLEGLLVGHAQEAAGTFVEQPELIGHGQAFLLGQACIHQSVAQALPGKSLIALVGCTAQSLVVEGPARRGFMGRPTGAAALRDAPSSCGLQATLLAPWSDRAADAQLSLLLLVIGLCQQDAASFVELGVEALAQQVLSSCQDVRQCYYMSVFLLHHLMQNQQERYWRALRHLFLQAQQLNDERLLQNPYLQVGVLLGMQ